MILNRLYRYNLEYKTLTMKRLLLPALAVLLAFGACEKIDELLTFSFSETVNFTVPASANINSPITIQTPPQSSSSTTEFEQNNTNADKVRDITLTELNLRITDPANRSFSFLNEIKVYITSNGLPDLLVASRTDIPDSIGSTLNVPTTNEDIDSYVKDGTYGVRTDVITDETFFQDIDIAADLTFDVTADPL